MSTAGKSLPDFFDEMSLKILLIEPGDLSVVGELLALAEKLLPGQAPPETPALIQQMAGAFKAALEKIIMGEVQDSAENYDLLGGCITLMQEVLRKKGQGGDRIVGQFAEVMEQMGLSFAADGEAAAAAPGVPSDQVPQQSAPPPPAGAAGTPLPDFLQDKDLLAGFIEEAFEHLESIEVNVLDLEQNPADMDIINNIFRPFHTIKGVSGFLNLKTINRLAHATENLLDDVRNGKRAMDSRVIDVVLTVGDVLRSMIANVKDVLEHGPARYRETDISAFLAEISRLQQENGGEEGPEPEVIPVEERQEGGEPEAPGAAEEAGESQAPPQASAPLRPPSSPPREAAVSPRGGEAGPKKINASIKVDVEKLDALVNAVGELVIMQSLVRQNRLVSRIADPKLTKDFSQLGRITSEIQRTAMSMRMVPIKQTFDKMIRLVRDLSRKSGKKVDLVMTGAETEIDRNMVDSIYDPLVHMMRNSVDHGIQPSAEREKHGKPGTGTVSLRAYQKGGSIVIEIEDDGEGLPTEKIRSKARERGLINEGHSPSDYELKTLFFSRAFPRRTRSPTSPAAAWEWMW